MSKRIITKSLNCGHCDYCKILKEGVYNDALCVMHHKRVSSSFPFCGDWTPKGFDVSLLLPDTTSGKNLPILVMLNPKG